MAEPTLTELRGRAIAALDAELRELGGTAAPGRRNDDLQAWLVPLRVPEVDTVTVAVDEAFPASWLRVYLPDGSKFLVWPHVERDGRLCLHDAAEEVPDGVFVSAAKNELELAREAIADGIAGRNTDDFVDEFDSYWPSSGSSAEIVVLNEVNGGHARALVLRDRFIVGRSDGELRRWAERFLGREPRHFTSVVMAPVAVPLLPPFPDTLAVLLETLGPGNASVLAKALSSDARSVPVVLTFEGRRGPVLAGCVVSLDGTTRASLKRGFRSGKTPPGVALSVLRRATQPITRCRVQRADAEWVHQRGGRRGMHGGVKEKIVAMIGCGSLGAPIALLLAQAGVGGIHLFDPDVLTWNNVGRHPLGGARSLGANKAEALRREIVGRYPHIDVEARPSQWMPEYRARPELLEVDLIISTAASWSCDAPLSLLTRTELDTPVLFGWAEPHALAGHAMVVKAVGGCLHCGMTARGRVRRPATQWSTSQELREASCGAFYSPMGAADLTPIASMIAGMALDELRTARGRSEHRVWLGSTRHLEELGGTWDPAWVTEHGEVGHGQRVVEVPWPPSRDCRLCSASISLAA